MKVAGVKVVVYGAFVAVFMYTGVVLALAERYAHAAIAGGVYLWALFHLVGAVADRRHA